MASTTRPEIINASTEQVPIGDIREHPRNPNRNEIAPIVDSIETDGFYGTIVVQKSTGYILAGNHRYRAAVAAGLKRVPVTYVDVDDKRAMRILVKDNRLAELAYRDAQLLAELLAEVQDATGLAGTGFTDDDLRNLLSSASIGTPTASASTQTLSERFGVPPFSVLNARDGWWQERKRAWISLGIQSELGRGVGFPGLKDSLERQQKWSKARAKTKNVISSSLRDPGVYKKKREGKSIAPPSGVASGISIFDPVLTELLVRWFTPPSGRILDPFAGGSVRGVVAAKLGRLYLGVELRPEQVAANRAQWDAMDKSQLLTFQLPDFATDEMPDVTPVERRGDVWVKRDDALSLGGGRGGKVRTCWALANCEPLPAGLVTAGSRSSPQVNIVAQVARKLGIPCRVHVPQGELSPEVQMAQAAGAEVVQHKAGRNSVIIARARDDARNSGWCEIPFGMECQAAVDATAAQVVNLPVDAKRLVIPVGSGMSLAGVLHGLAKSGRKLPVLAVQVGADPIKRLDKWAPADWRDNVELVKSPLSYHEEAPEMVLDGLQLDPIYEAKCLPYLRAGDVLWVVGLRATATPRCVTSGPAPSPTWVQGDSRQVLDASSDQLSDDIGQFDAVVTCPPYGDLEVYSDSPDDLSAMTYADFLVAYREILCKAAARLRDDRFFCIVVGEFRDKHGIYRNFVGETISALTDAGLRYYNEAILVTMVASASVRASRSFTTTRKLTKTHQNVLVFVKGNPAKATNAIGTVEYGDLTSDEQAVE